ncbi:hypothetical protein [Mycobacterium uberis]|uniref:hypothetical protein n=1 Tax=Mycobacterium uberis TaxID=2162698 RepID=UPI001058CE17|nr:hypothetical protein [Mycobacterium uberis]
MFSGEIPIIRAADNGDGHLAGVVSQQHLHRGLYPLPELTFPWIDDRSDSIPPSTNSMPAVTPGLVAVVRDDTDTDG